MSILSKDNALSCRQLIWRGWAEHAQIPQISEPNNSRPGCQPAQAVEVAKGDLKPTETEPVA